jgi:hypothetical protein
MTGELGLRSRGQLPRAGSSEMPIVPLTCVELMGFEPLTT